MPRRRKEDLDIDTKKGDLDIDKSKEYLDVDIDLKGSKRPRKPRAKTGPNKWMRLVRKVREDNPELSYREAMSLAKNVKEKMGYEEALGAGVSLKGIASKIGKFMKDTYKTAQPHVKKAFETAKPHVKKALKKAYEEGKPLAKEFGKTALREATPHLTKMGVEAVERGASKFTGEDRKPVAFSKIAREGATDVSKKLAHEGISKAQNVLTPQLPSELRPAVQKVAMEAHKQIGEGRGGAVGKYMDHCKACCDKAGGFAGLASSLIGPVVSSLLPSVVGPAVDLLSVGLTGKQKGKGVQQGGVNTSTGDFTNNELSYYREQNPQGGFLANLLGIPQVINAIKGQGLPTAIKSDPPYDNSLAHKDKLWWYPPEVGLIGVIEPPNDIIYDEFGVNQNAVALEQMNDLDDYLNEAPTFEDGVTSVVPTTLTIAPNMPPTADPSTIPETLNQIDRELGIIAYPRNRGGQGGFVYASGMSQSDLMKLREGEGRGGIVGSLPRAGGRNIFNRHLPSLGSGVGGDALTRMSGLGVTLPSDSVITGVPVGVSQRGTGLPLKMARAGRGAIIKGSNITTWDN